MSYKIKDKDSSFKAKKCYEKTGQRAFNNIRKTKAPINTPNR